MWYCTSLPGDLGGVEVEANEGADLLGRERAGVGLTDAQTLRWREGRGEIWGGTDKPKENPSVIATMGMGSLVKRLL